MFYKLLGMAVWKGAKWYLRRRVAPKSPAKALAAGGVAVLLIGAVVALMRRASS